MLFGRKKKLAIERPIESPPITCDDLTYEAAKLFIQNKKATIALIQHTFKIGFNHAVRIMDELIAFGIVGPEHPKGYRDVLVTENQLDEMFRGAKIEKLSPLDIKFDVPTSDVDTMIAQKYKSDWEKYYIHLYRPQIDLDPLYMGELRGYLDNIYIEKNNPKSLTTPQNVNHALVTSAKSDTADNIVTNLILNYPPESLQIIYMAEDSINRFPLVSPVIARLDNNEISISKTLKWALDHIQWRKQLFVQDNAKSLSEYNEHHRDEPKNFLPHVVIMVDEIATAISQDLLDLMFKFVMADSRFGFSIIMTTKLSQRSIKLGPCADLIEITEPRGYLWYKPLPQSKQSAKTKTKSADEDFSLMTGLEFEHYCAELLSKNGFEDVETTKASGDFGADVIAYKDDVKYVIQCKLYSEPVGISAVQEVIGSKSIYDCHVGAVMTNNRFTPAAIELAKKNLILLWDGDKVKKFAENAT